MNVVTIPQRMSGTGSIHSLQSEMYDRVIEFTENMKYAFVNCAYIGGYETFETEAEVAKFAHETDNSGAIMDCEGNLYALNYYDSEESF